MENKNLEQNKKQKRQEGDEELYKFKPSAFVNVSTKSFIMFYLDIVNKIQV